MAQSFYYQYDKGCETLDSEFKILNLNLSNLDYEEALELLKNGKWMFNWYVENTLSTYIEIYFAKYVVSFSDPMSKCIDPKLFIGIDDDGIVHGFPYQGNLSTDFIYHLVNKIFKEKIYCSNENLKKSYQEKIKIELVKVQKNNICPTQDEYLKYISELEEVNNKMKKYMKKKRTWEKLVITFNEKLHVMLNNKILRSDMVEYIKEKTNYKKSFFVEKYKSVYAYCDGIPDYYNLISEIKSNKLYNSASHNYIETVRNNPTNVFYWVTRWKDDKILSLKNLKPQSIKSLNKPYPQFILNQVPRMIPKWIQNNDDINLYVAVITMSPNLDSSTHMKYLDINSTQWIRSYRTSDDGIPKCLPL